MGRGKDANRKLLESCDRFGKILDKAIADAQAAKSVNLRKLKLDFALKELTGLTRDLEFIVDEQEGLAIGETPESVRQAISQISRIIVNFADEYEDVIFPADKLPKVKRFFEALHRFEALANKLNNAFQQFETLESSGTKN